MKRIAQTLAAALHRRQADPVRRSRPIAGSDHTNGLDWVDACRRSEAFAEDLGELVSRRPTVLAKREVRALMTLR